LLEEFHANPDVQERDKVFLKTFGFAYDSTGKRAIAVYLRYLSGLSSEHQQIWNAKLITGKYEIHPDSIIANQSTVNGQKEFLSFAHLLANYK
jgi:hypothetical protein